VRSSSSIALQQHTAKVRSSSSSSSSIIAIQQHTAKVRSRTAAAALAAPRRLLYAGRTHVVWVQELSVLRVPGRVCACQCPSVWSWLAALVKHGQCALFRLATDSQMLCQCAAATAALP
jgi:hypothetical protein